MEKKKKSKVFLELMGFSTTLVVFLLLFFGCFSYSPDFQNKTVIYNDTGDTLLYKATKKYITDFPIDDRYLYPGTNILCLDRKLCSFEMIEKDLKYRGDTIEIIRKGYDTIKWAAPLCEMPDSVHHFFNKNSWEIKMGGHKDEWEIATFTITEDDFVKN